MEFKIEQAFENIKHEIRQTNAQFSLGFSQQVGTEVFLKLENEQLTGSFKIRGAFNKLKSILKENPEIKKVVAASTGNHATAVVHAAQKFNLETVIFAPESISKAKLINLQNQNIAIQVYGGQSVETEIFAKNIASVNDLPFIHPYNDPDVIAGQGTIAIELLKQIDRFDAVFVPIGGGGLISGISSYLKAINLKTKIIGCQPENASEMHDSIKSGKIVQSSDLQTIADGTAGGLDPETITFEICKKYVDEIVLVSEDEIARAVYLIYKFHDMRVEPAAALSVAAILKYAQKFRVKKAVAIISGNKVNSNWFQQIINRFEK